MDEADDNEPDADADGDIEDDEPDVDDADEEDDQDPDETQDNTLESPSRTNNHGESSSTSFSLDGDPSNQSGPSQSAPTSHPNPELVHVSPSPRPGFVPAFYNVRPEALSASLYDIVPTIAAPHSTSINAIAATPDMRWVFSGGSDGYIRKFNWADTVNGKTLLTVAQRHPFVDSVTKAGVLTSYWENEEPSCNHRRS